MALTENQKIEIIPNFTRREYGVASGTIHFFKNAICNFNSSGYVELGSDTASEKFAGIAYEELDQESGGTNGDNSIKLIPAKSDEVVLLPFTGVVITNIGTDVYVNGDDAVALVATTTNDLRVGTIVDLGKNSNECYVKLN